VHDEPSPSLVPTGRGQLAVDVSGDPHGVPVFLLHGMPGSRSGPKPRPSVLYRLGVKLIAYDRPGYGESTRRKGRSVAGAAEDVATIADHLDIDRFAVVGRSGGGPHALACAALLPERVIRAAALGSVAPPDADGLDWFEGMAHDNYVTYAAADNSDRFVRMLRRRASRAVREPESIIVRLRGQMTDVDRATVRNVALRRLMAATFTEALKTGADGWIDDVRALRRHWEFDLDAIKAPVKLWHGKDDNFAPASHSRWLAERIPDAALDLQADSAHFAAVDALMELIPWLVDWPNGLSTCVTEPPPARRAAKPARRRAAPRAERAHPPG
jgi:pimeloyl-ACP methyl ester carboxylesterase